MVKFPLAMRELRRFTEAEMFDSRLMQQHPAEQHPKLFCTGGEGVGEAEKRGNVGYPVVSQGKLITPMAGPSMPPTPDTTLTPTRKRAKRSTVQRLRISSRTILLALLDVA